MWLFEGHHRTSIESLQQFRNKIRCKVIEIAKKGFSTMLHDFFNRLQMYRKAWLHYDFRMLQETK